MKTGTQYGNEVRALRAAGYSFPASSGYTLASPSQWSSGQKAAVTRVFNQEQRSISARKGWATRRAAAAKKTRKRKAPARKAPARKAPARKAPARKAPARKAPARKPAPKRKAPARKPAAKRKAPKRKAPQRQPTEGAGGGGGGGGAPAGFEAPQDFDTGITEEEGRKFYDDAFGELQDVIDEWDDIEYFDFEEGEEFADEEGDQYPEA